MQVRETGIEGLYELTPAIHHDSRGWFAEIFKGSELRKLGFHLAFVQDNLSFSRKGVIRGLHLQLPPFAQAKLVGVLQGRAMDAVVDLRKGSPTFRKAFVCELNSEKKNFLLIPENFAHGFSALEDSIFYYKCTSHYSPAHESGILWNDPELNIDWKVSNPNLSEKDRQLPLLKDLLVKSVI
jgi:dTDP-4-dehydrorhamnose 3,5-epimerase